MLIDEIHTPDSSRFWFKSSYDERMARNEAPESFDKEYLRRWLVGQGFRGDGPLPVIPDDIRIEASRRYIAACEQVQGQPFVPNLEAPGPRLARNLDKLGKR